MAVIGALRVDMLTNVGEFKRGMKKHESAVNRFADKAKAAGAALVGVLAVGLLPQRSAVRHAHSQSNPKLWTWLLRP